MFTVQNLRPEWGKGAISQDGQVTILDLPKSTWHTIFGSFLVSNLTFLYSLSLHVTQMMEISNLTFSQRGLAREYYSFGLEYFLGPSQWPNRYETK